MTENSHPVLSPTQQCQQLKVSRSRLYDKLADKSALNVSLMLTMDEQHLKTSGMARVK
jgi:hypothetical protein